MCAFYFPTFSFRYRTDASIMRKEKFVNSGNSKAKGTDTYVEGKKDREVLRATFNSADGLVLPAVMYRVTLRPLQDDKDGEAEIFMCEMCCRFFLSSSLHRAFRTYISLTHQLMQM